MTRLISLDIVLDKLKEGSLTPDEQRDLLNAMDLPESLSDAFAELLKERRHVEELEGKIKIAGQRNQELIKKLIYERGRADEATEKLAKLRTKYDKLYADRQSWVDFGEFCKKELSKLTQEVHNAVTRQHAK